ncbi:zinc finger protein 808-like [Belonocnema kinseyi]|uniref:zinc finger protein 808-like n=1 Tax=Belonocnema kinseyi TaxID=2817044 RepID=UPI00143DCC87|nr:zinc finger protein 808-like [Belonocnema kinseyi]
MKKQIIEAQDYTSQEHYKKYMPKLHVVDLKETDNFAVKNKVTASKNGQKIQESEQELEKKYKCEKCARRYKWKKHLNQHIKFECGVSPQFRCKFCDKRFKQNSHLKTHIGQVHEKTNL